MAPHGKSYKGNMQKSCDSQEQWQNGSGLGANQIKMQTQGLVTFNLTCEFSFSHTMFLAIRT
jgi:hypothetical protein